MYCRPLAICIYIIHIYIDMYMHICIYVHKYICTYPSTHIHVAALLSYAHVCVCI